MTKKTSKTMTPEQKRDAYNAAIRERWAKDPDFRARRKASFKKWRQGKGYEKFTEYQRKYKKEHYSNELPKATKTTKAPALRNKTRPCLIAGVAMTDLAKMAGVSAMTICRLVNKPELLTRKMRIKVLSGLVRYQG